MLTRREFLVVAAMAASLPLAACGSNGQQVDGAAETEAETATPTGEEDDVGTFVLEVGGRVFSGHFAETEAGRELESRLPLTLEAGELSGNEKYAYTNEDFPGDEETPSELHAGEIWIYSGDCIVLFYEDHTNPGYSYKFAGALDDPSGLGEAVGTGSVQIAMRQE